MMFCLRMLDECYALLYWTMFNLLLKKESSSYCKIRLLTLFTAAILGVQPWLVLHMFQTMLVVVVFGKQEGSCSKFKNRNSFWIFLLFNMTRGTVILTFIYCGQGSKKLKSQKIQQEGTWDTSEFQRMWSQRIWDEISDLNFISCTSGPQLPHL